MQPIERLLCGTSFVLCFVCNKHKRYKTRLYLISTSSCALGTKFLPVLGKLLSPEIIQKYSVLLHKNSTSPLLKSSLVKDVYLFFYSINIKFRYAHMLMQIEETAKNKKFCTIIIMVDQILEIV